MGLTIHVNTGTFDGNLTNMSAEWTEIDTVNDFLIFTAGSVSVADGEPIPSATQLNQAGVLLTGSEITLSKHFLADASDDELKQIHNMGAGNYRYVVAFDFDAATASEPVLEIWDDATLLTINNVSLGSGTPANSWFRGITTTAGLPGGSWTGSRLAGSADGNFLWLNNQSGALTGAATLYCQLKIVIPSSQVNAGTNANVIVVKYADV